MAGKAFASGPQIIFISDRDGFPPKLYAMNADGTNVKRLGTLQGWYGRPKFSPDNRKIVFSYQKPDQQDWQVYVMNADGSHEQMLSMPPGSNQPLGFNSDGRIVYWHELHPGSTTPPFTGTYIMDMDGSHKAPFPITAPGFDDIDDIAPGPRDMVGFTHQLTVGGYEYVKQIYTMGIGDPRPRQLTNSIESSIFPAWSPDGTKIAFVNNGANPLAFSNLSPHHEHDGIYIMNADGTQKRRIVQIDFSQDLGPSGSFGGGPGRQRPDLGGAPSFSPDGFNLTYALNLGGKFQIYMVNVNGKGLQRLTDPPSVNNEPSFSH
jgi:TolB protein